MFGQARPIYFHHPHDKMSVLHDHGSFDTTSFMPFSDIIDPITAEYEDCQDKEVPLENNSLFILSKWPQKDAEDFVSRCCGIQSNTTKIFILHDWKEISNWFRNPQLQEIIIWCRPYTNAWRSDVFDALARACRDLCFQYRRLRQQSEDDLARNQPSISSSHVQLFARKEQEFNEMLKIYYKNLAETL